MQYIEIVKLALAVISILIDVAKDVRAGGNDSDSIVERILGSVKSFGHVGDVKELRDLDLSSLAPGIKDIVKKIRDLKNTVELPK